MAPQISGSASAAAAAPAAASTSTGGGGSSKTTTVANEPDSVIVKTITKTFNLLTPEKTYVFSVDDSTIAITEVSILVNNNIENPIIAVSSLAQRPLSTVQPEGKVHSYLEIVKSVLENSDLERSTITFKVSKTWLLENKVPKEEMALYRFNGGNWVKLQTSIMKEDTVSVYYIAITPGFSYFAIAGGKVELEMPVETEKTTVIEEAAVIDQAPAEEAPVEEEPEQATDQSLLVTLLAAVIIIAIIIAIVMNTKKKINKNS